MNTSEYETIAEPFTYLQDVNFAECPNENENYINDTNTSNYEPFSNDNTITDFMTNFETENLSLKKVDPQQVLETLNLNRLLQAELDRVREGIDAAIQRNTALQTRLSQLRQEETFISEKTNLTSSVSQRTFGPPFFVDADGNTPPENDDETNDQPLVFKSTRWTQYEKEALRKGIQEHNMKREALRAIKEGRSISSVEKMSKDQFLYSVEDVEWSQLAKQYVPTKTKEDCIIQWTNHSHPCINNNEWTTQETRKLLEVAKQNDFRNWVKIALELGTNRTAAECFKQYNRQSSNPRKWSKEEDEILIRAVDLYGEKNWQQVAHCLDNRTGQQCLHRWTKTLNPAIRRGRWKKEDDEALKNAVSIYGPGNWVKIQRYVLGRTDVQCRERWMNVLSPEIKKDPWSNEEDEKLMSLVQSIGLGKWSKISSFMDGRTDNQCWRRYKVLKKQAGKKVEKTPDADSHSDCQPSIQSQDVTETTPLNGNVLTNVTANTEPTDVDSIIEVVSSNNVIGT
ncbi:9529_t:CDS:10 [Acaulospora morrowiae]|uniref:9529_t:CDS:1 n=1 Tax=Acaulospora morrowiae TaxID=94023 RepID=A0A9N8ZVM8_9GLOM|nr:9529_t:CDS:10 [Acaulospora morrowiae]